QIPSTVHRRRRDLASYPDEDLPQDILQNLVEELPQPREIPTHLDEYTQEEGWAFWRVGCPLQPFRNKKQNHDEISLHVCQNGKVTHSDHPSPSFWL
uniref:Uncharacterized protein n=1 Tax=Urocitellus parryii TaxID=9999 RepID=A0A8D2H085_UROPR